MKILVTGAAGFIGSHTCDFLLSQGHIVHGADDFRTGRWANLALACVSPQFHLHEIDLSESGAIDRLVRQTSPDVLVHLAGLVSVQESIANPALNQLLNVHMTREVKRAVELNGVRRVVFASSAAVYGEPATLPLPESARKFPQSPYATAKLESEHLLSDCASAGGTTVICLRYFNVYGSRQDPASPYSGVISKFAQKFTAGEPPTINGDGQQTRDFIHVSDVARANALAATCSASGTLSLNICTGEPTTLLQLVDHFRRWFPDTPAVLHVDAKPGDIRHSLGDPSAASTHLGFKARVALGDGLGTII